MGNTTASLTREQLFGGMRPNDSGQQLDGRSSL